MPELVDCRRNGLTDPLASRAWSPPWDASDVFANVTSGTAAPAPPAGPRPQITIDAPAPAEPIQQAIRQALALRQLSRGWNSYDARAISDRAVAHAIRFLLYTASDIKAIARPSVVPTVRGGVQLEWHSGGVDLEVEFGTRGPVSWCAEDRQTGTSYEEPVTGHEDELQIWLNRVSG